jgi:formate dehydrogenase subunit gamma
MNMSMKRKKQRRTVAFSDNSVTSKILRFRKSERLLHWALAVPFLFCLMSAIVLFVFYNPDPSRPYRNLFAVVHRIAGIAFVVLPALAILISKRDFKVHFYNIAQAWRWTLDDIKWLLMMGLASINKKIVLPEQGKFNAAEKLNFMYLMLSYPMYILTGFYIWETEGAFIAWNLHVLVALLALPLILGHIFMATINAGSRVGLSGMFSGYVDRHWAKHHYGKWFREQFEQNGKKAPVKNEAPSRKKNKTEVRPANNVAKTKTSVTRSSVTEKKIERPLSAGNGRE